MGSRLWAGVAMAGIGIGAAVVAFLGLLQWQHWKQDEANVHAMVQLLNYNVAQGKLVAVPTSEPSAAPQAPPGEKK